MHAQHPIRLGVGDDFGEAFRRGGGLGPRVGVEGNFPDLVADAGRLQLLFRLADAGHFRRGIDHGRNGVVIHVPGATRDSLDAGHRFVFRLVGQHGAFSAIADGPDVLDVGLEFRIGDHAPPLVERHANILQAEIVSIRNAPDGDEDHVWLEDLLCPASHRLDPDGDRVATFFHADDLGGQLELHALARQDALEMLGNLAVQPRGDAVEEFHHRHLAAEPAPHAAQLEPDIAGAHHQHSLGHALERQRPGGRDDALLVSSTGAMTMCLASSVRRLPSAAFTSTLPGAAMRASPTMASDLFFLSRNSTPRVSSPTTLVLCPVMPKRSSSTPVLIPSLGKSFFASSNSSLVCSNALEGMQPMLRQVPPKLPRLSTQALVRPSWPARIAALYPPGPPPMTTTSNELGMV